MSARQPAVEKVVDQQAAGAATNNGGNQDHHEQTLHDWFSFFRLGGLS